MTRLIYHPAEAPATTVSPIDEAIIDMVASKPIKIACPYLGQNLLQRIIAQCAGWQLLTDVEELLRSQGRPSRDRFVQFLTENVKHVRHCKRLHAKVIVAGQQALVGSANFTHSGLTQRAEMSVLLSDQATVDELESWFDDLWKRCPQIERDTLAVLAKSLPDRPPTEDKSSPFSLPTGPQIDATLKPITQMRDGRWTEDAYLGLVAEKWPHLLAEHTELIDSLKDISAVRFSGNGPKEATYHAVIPNTETNIMWVYAHGPIYARWGKLGVTAATRYKDLWSDLIDTNRPDGSDKNDGCYLEGGIASIDVDRVVQTILSMQEVVYPNVAKTSNAERKEAILGFLKSNPGQEFTAAEIKTQTGVPKAVVFKLLDGESGVAIADRGSKRFCSFQGE